MFKIKNLNKIFTFKKEKSLGASFTPLLRRNKKTKIKFKSKKSKTNLFIKFLPKLIPIVVLVCIGILIFNTRIFIISKIDCKTQYSSCSDQDETVLKELLGRNLVSIKTKEVEDKVTKNFSNRRVIVQKVFPGTLSVFLERRKPIIALDQTIGGEGFFLVDNDGVIVEFAKSTSLPIITLTPNSSLIVGGRVDSDILQAVKLMQLIYKAQKINTGNLEAKSFAIQLQNGIKVIFPLEKDPQVLVGALQLITSRIRIDGKVPNSIDLRYLNPVLTY